MDIFKKIAYNNQIDFQSLLVVQYQSALMGCLFRKVSILSLFESNIHIILFLGISYDKKKPREKLEPYVWDCFFIKLILIFITTRIYLSEKGAEPINNIFVFHLLFFFSSQ